jgi:hypothetical protein
MKAITKSPQVRLPSGSLAGPRTAAGKYGSGIVIEAGNGICAKLNTKSRKKAHRN